MVPARACRERTPRLVVPFASARQKLSSLPSYGSENTTTVNEPGSAFQKGAAAPAATARYSLFSKAITVCLDFFTLKVSIFKLKRPLFWRARIKHYLGRMANRIRRRATRIVVMNIDFATWFNHRGTDLSAFNEKLKLGTEVDRQGF